MDKDQLTELKHILIVDDEPGILEVVSYGLELLGVLVSTASSAEEALKMIDTGESYDLIISDVHMPFIDGRTLIQKISCRLHPNDVPPFVLMTGNREVESACCQDQLLGGLIFGYLNKPFSRQQLNQMVLNILKLPCETWPKVS